MGGEDTMIYLENRRIDLGSGTSETPGPTGHTSLGLGLSLKDPFEPFCLKSNASAPHVWSVAVDSLTLHLQSLNKPPTHP